jgi:hypothetical protein
MTHLFHGLNRGPQRAIAAITALCLAGIASSASAQNPLGVYTPINLSNSLPYRIELRERSLGDIDLPTLHSFAVGQFDGKWLMISGRTNGLHGFDGGLSPEGNFPPQSQNRDAWVIDPVAKQSWHRPLDDPTSGLSEEQIVSLAATNNQFYGKGNMLYVTGGYGVKENGTDFGTFDALSAIDMPGLSDWVMNGTGSAADHIRQIHDPAFKVTGGAMHEIDGRAHIVFGQDFDGVYTPFRNGTYTNQVRSFDIVDDGTTLSVQNITSTTPDSNYRRRDLNVVPILRPDGVGGHEEGLVALSGVFTPANDPWTVPVEIDADGNASMADPSDPATFQQGMNNYHSSKLGFFSQTSGEMHEVLFGGISLKYLDPVTQTIKTDFQLPFVNDITSVVISADGTYSQHHLGFFPELFDTQNRRLRLGTNSEFLLAEDAPKFDNGVIDFDALAAGENSLGFIYGGIIANAPHVRSNPEGLSSASNHVFEVVLIRVPEPTTLVMAAMLGIIGAFSWRHR